MALQTTFGLVSPAERDYITKGVELNVRNDGRGCFDYRHFTVDCSPSLLPNTNGAARVYLGQDLITDVMVGIKVEVAVPADNRPTHGRLAVAVDLCVACVTLPCSIVCAPAGLSV